MNRGFHRKIKSYRYGFNGKEKDQSGEWGDQTHYDYGFRIYNPSIGKFLSQDPLASKFAAWSPYNYTMDNPINMIDPDGLAPEHIEGDYYDRNGKYLGNDELDDGKVYVTEEWKYWQFTTSGENTYDLLRANSIDLGVSHQEFQIISSTIEHEAGSSNYEENLWIAHASNNEANTRGSKLSDLLNTTYSSVDADDKTPLSISNNNKNNAARAGVIDVLTGGEDPTGGATLWDGTDFIAWGLNSPNGTPQNKFEEYKSISISSNIFDTYLSNTNSKYTSGSVGYYGKRYTIAASVFKGPLNWGSNQFKFNTGAKVTDGLEATGAKGLSIFWKKVN